MHPPSAFLFLIIKHVPPKSVYTSFGGGLMTRADSTCFRWLLFSYFFLSCLCLNSQWGTVPCSALEFNLFYTKQTRHRLYCEVDAYLTDDIFLLVLFSFRVHMVWAVEFFFSSNKCFYFLISNKLVNRLVLDARVMTARQMNENKSTGERRSARMPLCR